MCSVGEDDFGDEGGAHTMLKDLVIENGAKDLGLCNKCKEFRAAVKLNFREAECENCFLVYVRHKFRAVLGSSKILPRDAHVAVVFDGSAESVVLLDMLDFTQTQNSFKRLHCNFKVIFLDTSCLKENAQHNIVPRIKELLKDYNFPKYAASLASPEGILELSQYQRKDAISQEEVQFMNNLNSIKSLTSRQDYVLKKEKHAMKLMSKKLDCNFIFVPDISSTLATALLNDISLGRGASTALDVSLMDDRDQDVRIIRPFKDLNDLEIGSYIKVRRLNYIESKSCYGDNQGGNASIQNLTKDFINGLQTDYPSTVSTIFRTGSKIAAKSDASDGEKCIFCFSSLDYHDSKTLHAIEFSKIVSAQSNQSLDDMKKLEIDATAKLEGDSDSCGDLLKKLCHGCRNIFMEFNGGDLSTFSNELV